ncbi:prepilin-type N-terminal cleavage/methylation domain-containing protein [Saccharibacillus endophyticus]|nr:prepilin-type N-terminal cleavage/methylation domain-containing protein [Saccharibacillus endophyticus]
MQRVWSKMGKDEKGFTLIELLAVLVIIAIIAVIAIPLIGNIINNSRTNADLATARQVYDASRLYVTDKLNGDFQGTGTPPTVTVNVSSTTNSLQADGFLEKGLYLPSTKKAITSGSVIYQNGQLKASGTAVTISDGTTDGTKNFTAAEILSSTAE